MSSGKVHTLHIYTDGGSRGNPGNAAIAFIIEDAEGNILEKHSRYIGVTTNNVAEYTALIKALEKATDYNAIEVSCFSDSEFMVDQLTGKDKVKKKHIRELYKRIKDIEKQFKKITYSHLKREDRRIKRVDRLVNEELNKRKGKSLNLHANRHTIS